jgi:hypothetical protein
MQVQTPVNPHNEVCSLRVHALIHERVVAEDVHNAFYASDKMLRMKSLVARSMHTLAPSTPFPDNHSGMSNALNGHVVTACGGKNRIQIGWRPCVSCTLLFFNSGYHGASATFLADMYCRRYVHLTTCLILKGTVPMSCL